MPVDWFTLLIIFIFFVLPLLQEVFRRRMRPPPEAPPAEQEEWEWDLPPGAEREASPRREAELPEGWAEGWEGWPAEREEAREGERREVSAWDDLGLEDIFGPRTAEPGPEPRPEPRLEPRPEPRPETPTEPRWEPASPAPVPAPSAPAPAPPAPPPAAIVPRETARSDRIAERVRRLERDPSAPLPQPASASAVQLPLAGVVRDVEELRRAIVLYEVLGPPRALRPPEQSAS